MDINFSLCFAVLLVLLVSIASAQDNNTHTKGPLLYTMQPMSQYSCNPYIVGRKRLFCALYQRGGLSNHTIRWFRRSNNSGNIETEMIRETNPRNEEYFLSRLSLRDFIEAEGPSDYWCQVGVYGEVNSTYEPSAVFKVLPRDAYIGYPPCTLLSLSQQVSMFAGNGSILTPVGIINTPTSVGTSPSSEQNLTPVLTVSIVISLFFVALLFLIICIFCCVLKSKRKLSSTEIDIIHSTNEPLQSLAAVDIHGNESITLPQEIDNSAGYVDVGAEGISPVDHPLRTSQANSMDYLQDNAAKIHYHAIDVDGMDKREYTDLRKPPRISPKPRGVKSQSLNCQQAFAVKRMGGEKLTERTKPLPLPKNKDKNRAPSESPLQSQRIGQPSKQDYQALSSSTKNRVELYTCPAEVSASSESVVYAN